MRSWVLLMGMLCMVGISFAAVSNSNFSYPFQSLQKQQQFQRLRNSLRCMVCQNETIAASTATFATDISRQVYQMVRAGKSDREIKRYMADRYGNFILFKPPFIRETYLLWLAPALLLLLGAIIAYCIVRKYREPK